MKKGQISTELLIVVGLVLVIFIPLLVLVYFKAGEAQTEMAAYQAQLVVFRIAYLSNSVGSLGTETTVYTDLYIPRNTISLRTMNTGDGAEVQLKLQGDQGETDIAEVIRYHLTSDSETELIEEGSYGWARFQISSIYEEDEGKIRIERVN